MWTASLLYDLIGPPGQLRHDDQKEKIPLLFFTYFTEQFNFQLLKHLLLFLLDIEMTLKIFLLAY